MSEGEENTAKTSNGVTRVEDNVGTCDEEEKRNGTSQRREEDGETCDEEEKRIGTTQIRQEDVGTCEGKRRRDEVAERRSPLLVRYLKHPLFIIVAVIFVSFMFHPKLFNIRLSLSRYYDEPVPMNFVSNFFLWTRSNRHEPETIIVGLPHQLSSTHFRSKKTYVLIHGFTRTGQEKWVIDMKNALLWKEDCNVISVDWQAGSVTMGYYVIQERVPAVGQDVARLITFLKNDASLGVDISQFHVIGHSLGAHAAGFAGKELNHTLLRITGLDPAGLGYNGAGAYSRLDASDAAFVDVIHTHGCQNNVLNQFTNCYGTYQNMGDADYWPNGGGSQAPCHPGGDGPSKVREGSNCHHGMAYVYYTASIYFTKTSTRFRVRECESLLDFVNGSCSQCGKITQYMGFNAIPNVPGVFYLNTSATSPYGLLEPYCPSAEYSWIRVTGILLCIILSLTWCCELILKAISALYGPAYEERVRDFCNVSLVQIIDSVHDTCIRTAKEVQHLNSSFTKCDQATVIHN